jgi:hypothetical protein
MYRPERAQPLTTLNIYIGLSDGVLPSYPICFAQEAFSAARFFTYTLRFAGIRAQKVSIKLSWPSSTQAGHHCLVHVSYSDTDKRVDGQIEKAPKGVRCEVEHELANFTPWMQNIISKTHGLAWKDLWSMLEKLMMSCQSLCKLERERGSDEFIHVYSSEFDRSEYSRDYVDTMAECLPFCELLRSVSHVVDRAVKAFAPPRRRNAPRFAEANLSLVKDLL